MIKRYGEWVVRHRFLVLILSLLVVFGLASGGRFLAFTNDYRVFFSEENPELIAFEELQDTYTKNDNVLIMLEPDGGDVFTANVLSAVADLTEGAWQVPHSIRVDSITNYQHTYAEGDDLIVEDLVYEPTDLTEDQLQQIRDIALAQPQIVNRLLSPTGDVTGVNITINVPDELTDEERLLPKEERDLIDPAVAMPASLAVVNELLAEVEARYPDIKFYKTGIVVMNQAFPEASISDMQTIIPMAFTAILVGIWILVRSSIAMLGTVLVVLFSILAGMGTAGYMGIKLTPPSASAPTLILTLAVADCIHYLVSMFYHVRHGMTKQEAIVESLRINFTPIFLTSVTTAIGFLSMNFSDSPPFRDLGNITAIGVIYAFLLAVTFLPAFTAIMPIKEDNRDPNERTSMDALADFVIRNQKALLVGMGALIVVLAALAPINKLNDVFVNYFDRSVPFRVETDHISEKLAGMYLLDYSIDSKSPGGVSEPEFLNQVEALEKHLLTYQPVQHVNTFTETMRRLNKSMHSDDEAYYRIPEDRELAAQLQLMYEMSLPYGLDLNNQINFDKSATRLTATLDTMSTNDLLAMESSIYQWMQKNTPDIAIRGSGPTVMFSNISMRNIVSMLTGTSIALVLISAILIFALRSLKFGLLSLIPNIAPALVAFGLWGLTMGEVGLAVSVVVAMTLGIVVDDTIHYLSKYLRARRERGMDSPQAVRYAFKTVGVALLVTTIVLVIGFFVISTSSFLVNSQMGLLTALTIAIALIIDFLFLPPLLMKIDGNRHQDAPALDNASGQAPLAAD